MRTVTVIVENEPLTVDLAEEEWAAYSQRAACDVLEREEWRRKIVALNAADRRPPVRERGAEGVIGFGCAWMALVGAVAFGVLLGHALWR